MTAFAGDRHRKSPGGCAAMGTVSAPEGLFFIAYALARTCSWKAFLGVVTTPPSDVAPASKTVFTGGKAKPESCFREAVGRDHARG